MRSSHREGNHGKDKDITASVLSAALSSVGVTRGLAGPPLGVQTCHKVKSQMRLPITSGQAVGSLSVSLGLRRSMSFLRRVSPCGQRTGVMMHVYGELKVTSAETGMLPVESQGAIDQMEMAVITGTTCVGSRLIWFA